MQQKIVACACIYQKVGNDVKILVAKRSLNADFLPGVYEIPGGHIDPGEELITGLKREIREELNIEIEVGDLISAFTFVHKDYHTIEVVYLATTPDPSIIKIQENEVDSYTWISEKDVESLIGSNKPAEDQELPILKKAFHQLKSKSI